MGILKRLLAPWTSGADRRSASGADDYIWNDMFPTESGVVVNSDSAQRVAAVYRCVDFLANSVATKPVCVHRRLQRGSDRLDGHPVSRLLRNPNDDMTQYQFIRALIWCWGFRGNALAFIERDRTMRPVSLTLMDPDAVEPVRIGEGKALHYRLIGRNHEGLMRQDQVLHLRAPSTDGIWGMSPIKLARETLGVALAAQKFGAGFFKRGAAPKGVLEHPATLSDDAARRIRKSWNDTYGGTDNAHKTALLEEGVKYSAVSISPEDAQFVETREFEVVEFCRWYGVPPHKVFDLKRATFSNIEHQSTETDTDSVLPLIIQFEQECDRKLLMESEKDDHRTKVRVNAMMRADTKTRSEYYKQMLGMGVITRNEVRALEDMNPLPDDQNGDEALVPLNMAPASQDPDERSIDRLADIRAAMTPVLVRAISGLVSKETKALQRACQPGKNMEPWAVGFYEKHRAMVFEAAAPAIRAAARVMGGISEDDEYLAAHVDAFADQYVDEAIGAIRSGDPALIVETWRESRAESVAVAEFDALVAWMTSRKAAA